MNDTLASSAFDRLMCIPNTISSDIRHQFMSSFCNYFMSCSYKVLRFNVSQKGRECGSF